MMTQSFVFFDERPRGMAAASLWPAGRMQVAPDVPGHRELPGLLPELPQPVVSPWVFGERRVALAPREIARIPGGLRVALGFSGFLMGLFASAVLILCMAMSLAVAGANWGVSGTWCVMAVAVAFLAVGVFMRWSVHTGRPYQTNLLTRIESAITPPPAEIDISSVNALENLRAVSMARRPASNKIASRSGPSLIHQYAPVGFS